MSLSAWSQPGGATLGRCRTSCSVLTKQVGLCGGEGQVLNSYTLTWYGGQSFPSSHWDVAISCSTLPLPQRHLSARLLHTNALNTSKVWAETNLFSLKLTLALYSIPSVRKQRGGNGQLCYSLSFRPLQEDPFGKEYEFIWGQVKAEMPLRHSKEDTDYLIAP